MNPAHGFKEDFQVEFHKEVAYALLHLNMCKEILFSTCLATSIVIRINKGKPSELVLINGAYYIRCYRS